MVRNLCSFVCSGIGVALLCLGMMGQALNADPGTAVGEVGGGGSGPPPKCTGCTPCVAANLNDGSGATGTSCATHPDNNGKCKTPPFGGNCTESICKCRKDGSPSPTDNKTPCKCKM